MQLASLGCRSFNSWASRSIDPSEVKLWVTRGSTRIRTLSGHTNSVTQLKFSPDGQRLFSEAGSSGSSQRIAWDVSDGKRIDVPNDQFPQDFEALIDRSLDGKWLAVSDGGQRIRLLELSPLLPDELTQRAGKAKIDPNWHEQQAIIAERDKDWYAATFHRTWLANVERKNDRAWTLLANAARNTSAAGLSLPPKTIQVFEERSTAARWVDDLFAKGLLKQEVVDVIVTDTDSPIKLREEALSIARLRQDTFDVLDKLAQTSQSQGDSDHQMGRFVEATANYAKAMDVLIRLIEADHIDGLTHYRLLSVYEKLNQISVTTNKPEIALPYRTKVCEINYTLNPHSIGVLNELAGVYNQLAIERLQAGKRDEADAYFLKLNTLRVQKQQRHERLIKLAASDPNNYDLHRELATLYEMLGYESESLMERIGHFSKCHDILIKIAVTDPNDWRSWEHQRILAESFERLGNASQFARLYDDAAARFKEGIAVLDRMIQSGQSVGASEEKKAELEERVRFLKVAFGDWNTLRNADANALRELLVVRATEMLRRRELAAAVQAGDKLRELGANDTYNLYNAACVYSLCAEFVTKDKPTPTAAELAERQKFLNLAIDSLKAVLAAGWNNFDHMKKDDDLKPLHGLPEFEAMFPKDP